MILPSNLATMGTMSLGTAAQTAHSTTVAMVRSMWVRNAMMGTTMKVMIAGDALRGVVAHGLGVKQELAIGVVLRVNVCLGYRNGGE